MSGNQPKGGCLWLPLAEWWYNTHFHSSTQLTPYEVVYNQPPPLHLPYLAGESTMAAVDRSLQRREAMIKEIKIQLLKAQNRMKTQADQHRSERSLLVGDWVWLKLQAYRQAWVQRRSNNKLAQKDYGPFQVLAIIGKVAYKLKLPSTAQTHDVFHVSQLKKFHGILPVAAHIPDWFQGQHVTVVLQPAAILERKVVKFQNKSQVQYLVQWEGYSDSEATWESAEDFEKSYPSFVIP